LPAGRPPDIPFERHTLDLGANEACAFADVNGDGKLDIVSGENWYEAPDWKKHRFRTLFFSNNYIDDFGDLPLDVDGDGHIDIITATWFGKKLSWWKNPGRGQGTWTEHEIDSGHNTEFAFLVDIDNDGQRREVLPQYGGKNSPLAWYEFRGGKWVRHIVSPNSYGHGIGAGDVNGDGRTDILTPKGWFEAPADPRQGEWKHHPARDSDKALGFIYVHDVNGDGRPDVITSHAHDYGIVWLEAAAAPAAGCRFRWPTSMAMLTSTLPSRAKAACFCSRTRLDNPFSTGVRGGSIGSKGPIIWLPSNRHVETSSWPRSRRLRLRASIGKPGRRHPRPPVTRTSSTP
jgi:hypothetical protein